MVLAENATAPKFARNKKSRGLRLCLLERRLDQ